MRYLKTYESFKEPSNREEMIETLYNTSTFEIEELQAMTDDELEELFHSLETEEWLGELDRESTEKDEKWIGGPYNPREEEEGDEDFGTENFTHNDIGDVRELAAEDLSPEQISIETGLSLTTVKRILSLRVNESLTLWDEFESLDEAKKSGVSKSLKKKSKASGIPVGILRKVFSRGMQAWNAGHRPGVAQHQWGMGRVNSFITGAGGARKADSDLWSKAKAAKARKKKSKKRK